jgi:DNA repair photolyase
MENKENLLERINPKFRSAFDGMERNKQEACFSYFFPHKSQKTFIEPTRPRMIKFYCPFGHQARFPSGHRYCLNTYISCSHNCNYCYVTGYRSPDLTPKIKTGFEILLNRDLADLEEFNVPPAPLHISNSTDPFQEELELKHGHTRLALQKIIEHRHLFTTVTLLTKNPLLPVKAGYISLFNELMKSTSCSENQNPVFRVQVSLAFWNETSAQFYDRSAPSVASRKEGIISLRKAGIPVVLRIDPLFPRSPLPGKQKIHLNHFGLVEAQTIEELRKLAEFGKSTGVDNIVFSPLKIVKPRGRTLDSSMLAMLKVYREMTHPGKPEFRGGSWRLPREIATTSIIDPFLNICRDVGVKTVFCMNDLIDTK